MSSRMLATPIRHLRDTNDPPPQKLANKEYIRLVGDLPVEAKAGDGENDGEKGSGDETLREGGRRGHPNSLGCSGRVCRS